MSSGEITSLMFSILLPFQIDLIIGDLAWITHDSKFLGTSRSTRDMKIGIFIKTFFYLSKNNKKSRKIWAIVYEWSAKMEIGFPLNNKP